MSHSVINTEQLHLPKKKSPVQVRFVPTDLAQDETDMFAAKRNFRKF